MESYFSPVLIGVISGLIVALLTILISMKADKYFQRNKLKKIKTICFYHLEKLSERLKPNYKEGDKAFFGWTNFNEIRTAWYVYEMLLQNIEIFDPEKFKNTMEFFHNYSINIEQIKSRISENINGWLTVPTFEKLKSNLESALEELK